MCLHTYTLICCRVHTYTCVPIYLKTQTFYLLHEEGFFVGASSGLNVAAAVKVIGSVVASYSVC